MQREEFKKLVKKLKAIYCDLRFIPDQEAFDAWFRLLEDCRYRQLEIAAENYMKENRYPPTVADLREKYREIEEQNRRDMARVEDLFRRLADLYPLGYDDGLARGVFFRILGKPQADGQRKTKEQVLQEAERIVRLAHDFIRCCEQSGVSDIPCLSVFLQTEFGGKK